MKTKVFTAIFMLGLGMAVQSFAQEAAKAPLMFRSAFSSVLRGTEATFTVHKTAGAGYYWNFPSSWKVVKGQGSSEITFSLDENSVTGIVTVEESGSKGRRAASIPVMVYSARSIQPTKPVTVFELKASPTVSSSYFNVQVNTGNTREPVLMHVTDLLGRTVELRGNVNPNAQFQVGGNYQSGVYLVEVMQGETRQQVKLVKQ